MDQENQLSKNEQKRAHAESSYKARKIKKIAFWIIGIVAVAGAIWGLTIWSGKTSESLPGERHSILGRTHIGVNEEHESYNSNPPTSGSHYASPAPLGVYQEELPDEQLIHNLEHGGIWISYGTDATEESVALLEEIGRRFSRSVIVTPRTANDAPIAIASWGRLLKLDVFDEQQITDFISKNRNRAPERLTF